MALYKKSSVEIPPIEKEKKAEEYRSRLGSEKDNEIIGEDDVITGELDKKAQSSLSLDQKIGLVGAGLLGITAGGSVYNYKTLADYEKARQAIDPSFKGDTKKAKVFNAIKDATKTTFTGKTKIPFGKGAILEKPTYGIGQNTRKTFKLAVKPIENLIGSKKSINPIKIEKPINVEQPTVTPDKPNVKINTAKSGYTEGPFPIETKPTVAPEANKKVFSKKKGRVSKFQRMMEADVFPSPTNAGAGGTNMFSIQPNMQKLWNLKPGLNKGAGIGGALVLNEIFANTKDNPDRGIAENVGDAISSFIDPRSYTSMLGLPKTIVENMGVVDDGTIASYPYKAIKALDYIGKKAGEGLSYVIDNATKSPEQVESENKTMELYKDNPKTAWKGVMQRAYEQIKSGNQTMGLYDNTSIAKQQGVIRKAYSKPGSIAINQKETPDYDGLYLQKAVMYGDTKRSGLNALETISASTGIPTDKLLSEGRKIWSKRKK